MTIILSNLNRFTIFFTGRIPGKFAIKCIQKSYRTLHMLLHYVVKHQCQLMSAKQANNDKLQGSVAAYLRCGGVVNNQIKKGLLLTLRVKKIKIVE